jgi:NitT/TauT family transport system ATP-binding protein
LGAAIVILEPSPLVTALDRHCLFSQCFLYDAPRQATEFQAKAFQAKVFRAKFLAVDVDRGVERENRVSGRIAIEEVSKVFRRGETTTHAIQKITLDVAEREFVSIVGPSGCGKSTLLRLISGLISPTSGSIAVGGRRVKGPIQDVGIVFQAPVLLDWRNVLGNVLFQIEMRGMRTEDYVERARGLLAQVGLAEFTDRYPYELSGGMRQRCSIARALIHDPGTLIMDEPFGALDALTREQMRLDLEALWLRREKTVLFITHSIDEAVLLSDRVVVMSPRPGRIERIISVPIERPRGLSARKHPEFLRIADEITNIFLSRGVLTGASATGLAS